jgi:hypothetical protein
VCVCPGHRAGFWVRENTEKERTDGQGVTDLCVCEFVRNADGGILSRSPLVHIRTAVCMESPAREEEEELRRGGRQKRNQEPAPTALATAAAATTTTTVVVVVARPHSRHQQQSSGGFPCGRRLGASLLLCCS